MSGLKSFSQRLDLADASAHDDGFRSEHSPSADGCARRVAFNGWAYVLVPSPGGAVLVTEEIYHRRRTFVRAHGIRSIGGLIDGVRLLPEDRAACLRVTPSGEIVDASGAVLGDRGDLLTTVRRFGSSPLKAEAYRDAIPCACRGCAPVAVDDGNRPRGMILQTQESTANVGTPLRRKLQIESRVPPADADAPECAGCGKVVPLATDGICWLCMAKGYLNGGGA